MVIAEEAGPQWVDWARRSAIALSAKTTTDETSLGVLLLTHLREVWDDDSPHMFTETILQRLCSLDEAPWSDWYGRAFTPRDLAKQLRVFGVASHPVRIGDSGGKKGYSLADLLPLWRDIPPEMVNKVNKVNKPMPMGREMLMMLTMLTISGGIWRPRRDDTAHGLQRRLLRRLACR